MMLPHLLPLLVAIAQPSPIHMATIHTPDLAMGVDVHGDMLYIADRLMGLLIVDVSDPANPVPLAGQALPGDAWDVAVEDGYAYVAAGTGGLQIVDVSRPDSPDWLGGVGVQAATHVDVKDGILGVTDEAGAVHLIDVTSPLHPVPIGTLESTARAVDVTDDLVFIGDAGAGLRVTDLHADLLGTIDLPGTVRAIARTPTHVIIAADAAGILILDPTRGEIVGSTRTAPARDIAIAGNAACIADARHGLTIVDLADATGPRTISTTDTPSVARALAVQGSFAFVAAGDAGILAYDISPCVCPADLNHDGILNLNDIVTFQLGWQGHDPAADCTHDGSFTVQDFLCYQMLFQTGCP